ncbi:hypothetical protein [Marinobacter sp. F3R08]|uniref:hypothetical protein n=1 Tax=Marinobacter sp. F3R08 TaxID=2841559 RepID=UPI001C08B801|nr:hypothetical protein [Marinobacter sp. F3R08]MBU2954947.1 hypothetical protein [Marinobacter sp. F3R08]
MMKWLTAFSVGFTVPAGAVLMFRLKIHQTSVSVAVVARQCINIKQALLWRTVYRAFVEPV